MKLYFEQLDIYGDYYVLFKFYFYLQYQVSNSQILKEGYCFLE